MAGTQQIQKIGILICCPGGNELARGDPFLGYRLSEKFLECGNRGAGDIAEDACFGSKNCASGITEGERGPPVAVGVRHSGRRNLCRIWADQAPSVPVVRGFHWLFLLLTGKKLSEEAAHVKQSSDKCGSKRLPQ